MLHCCNTVSVVPHIAPPFSPRAPFPALGLGIARERRYPRIRAFAPGVCLKMVISLMIALSLDYPNSELNCCTAVYYLYVFLREVC